MSETEVQKTEVVQAKIDRKTLNVILIIGISILTFIWLLPVGFLTAGIMTGGKWWIIFGPLFVFSLIPPVVIVANNINRIFSLFIR